AERAAALVGSIRQASSAALRHSSTCPVPQVRSNAASALARSLVSSGLSCLRAGGTGGSAITGRLSAVRVGSSLQAVAQSAADFSALPALAWTTDRWRNTAGMDGASFAAVL